jgi:hypothetical protein
MSTTPETSAQSLEKPNGLATYLKILYAPGEAFATLSRIPTWGWAAAIAIVLSLAGAFLIMPATMHFAHVAQERQLSQMPADQAANARETMAKIPQWVNGVGAIVGAVIGPWFYWLIVAVVFLIGAALGGGEARFKLAWVAAVNCYIIALLGAIITWATISLRGPDSVSTMSDFFVLPSLGMFVHGSPKLETFLYGFNIINIWFFVVAVIALQQLLKVRRGAAIGTVVVLALVSAGFGALFAR